MAEPIVDECPPAICTVLTCLEEVINNTEYTVDTECGKGGVVISLQIVKQTPGKSKGGDCGRQRIDAQLVVEIDVTHCSEDRCAAAIAHQRIKAAFRNSRDLCCTTPNWFNTDMQRKKDQSEIWTTYYTMSFLEN